MYFAPLVILSEAKDLTKRFFGRCPQNDRNTGTSNARPYEISEEKTSWCGSTPRLPLMRELSAKLTEGEKMLQV